MYHILRCGLKVVRNIRSAVIRDTSGRDEETPAVCSARREKTTTLKSLILQRDAKTAGLCVVPTSVAPAAGTSWICGCRSAPSVCRVWIDPQQKGILDIDYQYLLEEDGYQQTLLGTNRSFIACFPPKSEIGYHLLVFVFERSNSNKLWEGGQIQVTGVTGTPKLTHLHKLPPRRILPRPSSTHSPPFVWSPRTEISVHK